MAMNEDPISIDAPRQPSRCPGCGQVMSFREENEQGECNECRGGAWSPED